MRTTLVIDDALLRQAKQLAARRGLSLSALVEAALREELRGGSQRNRPGSPFRMTTFGPATAEHDHTPEELSAALLDDEIADLRRGSP